MLDGMKSTVGLHFASCSLISQWLCWSEHEEKRTRERQGEGAVHSWYVMFTLETNSWKTKGEEKSDREEGNERI